GDLLHVKEPPVINVYHTKPLLPIRELVVLRIQHAQTTILIRSVNTPDIPSIIHAEPMCVTHEDRGPIFLHMATTRLSRVLADKTSVRNHELAKVEIPPVFFPLEAIIACVEE